MPNADNAVLWHSVRTHEFTNSPIHQLSSLGLLCSAVVANRQTTKSTDRAALERQRNRALGLDPPPLFETAAAAERFLAKVAVALRYGAGAGLPLASLYHAAAGPEREKAALIRAIELTNGLMGTGAGIEVNVIAERLALVHRSAMPFLYALVRRRQTADDVSDLTLGARVAYQMIRDRNEITAGMLRKRLGVAGTPKSDAAYEALAELQRRLLVDRGPFEVRRSGIPYLPKEGYPYHFFHVVHADLAKAAARHSPENAAARFLRAYVGGAVFCSIRKMTAMFRQFLTAEEIEGALTAMAAAGQVTLAGKGTARIAVAT